MKTSVKLSKLEREYILTNAEALSCIGYWVEEFIEVKYSPINKPDYRLLSLTVRLDEYAHVLDPLANIIVTIDHKTIQKGIDVLFVQEGYKHIKSAVIDEDSDAETTDVIIQLGVFGEVIYG